MSPLLKIYNWLIGIGAMMLFMETGFKDLSEKTILNLVKFLQYLVGVYFHFEVKSTTF